MRSLKICSNYVWGLSLRGVILRPSPSTTDIILEVPTTDELFNFILKCDTLLHGVTNVLVVSTIFALVSLGAVSTQRVRLLEHSSLLYCHEDVLSRRDQVGIVGKLAGRRSRHSQV